MESNLNHFKSLNHDLIFNIISRLDGPTLASAATACTDLRFAVEDESLWQELCHKTWPSTSKTRLPFRKTRGFKSLYAEAFPLILHGTKTGFTRTVSSCTPLDSTPSSPSDFISFIDIYHEGQCIFSKVVHGITQGILQCYPFQLNVLSSRDPEDFSSTEIMTKLPSTAFLNCEDNIVNSLRLSWILFDRRKGKAANISSWRPRLIQKFNSSDKWYVISFGCAVNMAEEIVITAKCKLLMKRECIRWKEIGLVIKSEDNSHLNGEQSMRAMRQVIDCSRSVNHRVVESRYQDFCRRKMKVKLRGERRETLANFVSAAIAIAALLGLGYGCAALL